MYFFPVETQEARIIERPGLGKFLAEEGAWLFAALAATVMTATMLTVLGGPWALLAPAAALFGLHILVGLHVVRTELPKLPAWFRVDRRAVGWGLGGGVLLVGFNLLYGLVLGALGIVPPDVADMLRGLLPEPALIAWAAILAPVVEELYFRGRLIDELAPRVGPRWASAISALGFAAIHGIPAFLPAYLVFALVLLALRRKTGGLTAPILAHAINNGLALFAPS
jgi:hypothetical protein